MDEYISRAGIIAEYDRQHQGPPGRAREIMETFPAADVRPVVLCRDCKHGQGAKMDFWNEYEGIECIGGVVHRKDWFCADGEKKEEA